MFLDYISEFELWKEIKAIILKLYYAKVSLKYMPFSIPKISEFKFWMNVHINHVQEILMQVDLGKHSMIKKSHFPQRLSPKFLPI